MQTQRRSMYGGGRGAAFLQTLKTWAINWALSVMLAFAFLVLNATLDGPSETDAVRATDLAVMDAIAAEEARRP